MISRDAHRLEPAQRTPAIWDRAKRFKERRGRAEQMKQKWHLGEVRLLQLRIRLRFHALSLANLTQDFPFLPGAARKRCVPVIFIRSNLMQTSFRKLLIVCGLALGVTAMGQNAGADPGDTLRWKSLIGIVQPDNEVGNGTGTVTGSGIPWSTLDGHARVDLGKGSIDFRVRGLVLAGGNAIGTTGAIPKVKGTLMCDTDGSASGGKSVLVDTPLVDLGEQGDAEFSGSVGSLPAVCESEPDVAFLIRVGSGRWIANGTVLRSYDARSLTSGQPIIHPEENRDAY